MLAVLGLLAAPPAAGAQTLDRILAVVSGHVITASDVRAFRELGLTGAHAERAEADAEQRVLEYLIDRRLMLEEADRILLEPPPPARLESAVDEVAERFPSRGAFAAFLARTGLSLDDLRQVLGDEARLDSHLRERFGASDPAEDDLRAYYEEHAEEFGEGRRPMSFEEARATVRRRMTAQRDAAVEDWIAGLERRAPIARFDR